MNTFFQENGFTTLNILHNNCYFYGDLALCGTRGWFFEENAKPQSAKVFRREVMRLEASLKAADEREKLCFLHYPPLYQGYTCPEILALLEQYGVTACYYGHLHGGATVWRWRAHMEPCAIRWSRRTIYASIRK